MSEDKKELMKSGLRKLYSGVGECSYPIGESEVIKIMSTLGRDVLDTLSAKLLIHGYDNCDYGMDDIADILNDLIKNNKEV